MKLYGKTSDSTIYEREDGKKVWITKKENGYDVRIYVPVHGSSELVAAGCSYSEAKSVAREMYYAK